MMDRSRRVSPLRRTGLAKAPDWFRRVPTGSSRDARPSARAQRLVFARAFGFCESCGVSVIGRPYTIAPRVVQDTGGYRAEASAMFNLVLLCGSANSPGGCHLRCERRDPDMHDRGFWLWSGEDPEIIPVLLFNPDGPRIRVWPNGAGTYAFKPALTRTR
jgi:5-methylcytosine-specific restriction enzyme A